MVPHQQLRALAKKSVRVKRNNTPNPSQSKIGTAVTKKRTCVTNEASISQQPSGNDSSSKYVVPMESACSSQSYLIEGFKSFSVKDCILLYIDFPSIEHWLIFITLTALLLHSKLQPKLWRWQSCALEPLAYNGPRTNWHILRRNRSSQRAKYHLRSNTVGFLRSSDGVLSTRTSRYNKFRLQSFIPN
jgi:hypothetical protein